MQERLNFKKERVLSEHFLKLATSLFIPMDIKNQTSRIKGDEDVSFIGDFNWTREAVINILKNCIEHTPEGGDDLNSF